jgi:hypothetical protein
MYADDPPRGKWKEGLVRRKGFERDATNMCCQGLGRAQVTSKGTGKSVGKKALSEAEEPKR